MGNKRTIDVLHKPDKLISYRHEAPARLFRLEIKSHNSGMKIGYARVSTLDQNPDLQHRALKRAGCRTIHEDRLSGRSQRRPGLDRALAQLAAGDVLIVWRLDRLGRDLPHLLATVKEIETRGAGFCTLTESIDTTSAGGTLIFHLMGALAQFERALIEERTRAGLAAVRKRGVQLGRKPALSERQVAHARQLIKLGSSPTEVARTLNVGRATLYRHLAGR